MENWDSGCDSKAQDQAPSLPHPWHMLQRADPLLGQVHSSQAFAPTIPLPGNPLFTSELMEVNALASQGSFQSSLLAALFSHALCCSRNLSLFFSLGFRFVSFSFSRGISLEKRGLVPSMFETFCMSITLLSLKKELLDRTHKICEGVPERVLLKHPNPDIECTSHKSPIWSITWLEWARWRMLIFLVHLSLVQVNNMFEIHQALESTVCWNEVISLAFVG